MDCSVTFYGNDYAAHTTCVSEAEKYEKTLYKAKPVKTSPQDLWNTLIETATSNVETAPAIVRPYLQRLGELNNVPRNKKKFINFAKNSLRLYSDNVLEALWTYLDNYRVEQKKEVEEEKVSASSKPVPVVAVVAPIVEAVAAADCDEEDEEKLKKEKKKAKKEKRKREVEQAEEAEREVEPEVDEKLHKKKKSKKDKKD